MLKHLNLVHSLQPIVYYLLRPARILREYDRHYLRSDLLAGITVAIIALPQGIAFALIAELPPEMGVFSIIVASIVGALWGSSSQMMTGPANAISLLVFSGLAAVVQPGTGEFVVAAGMMAVMVGLFQLVMGLARLGVLVNFVSRSVIVGFASGAGVLIAIRQLRPLLGLTFTSHNILDTLWQSVALIPQSHIPTATIGIGTLILVAGIRWFNRKIPTALIGLFVSSVLVFALDLREDGVATLNKLPTQLPPIANLPLLNLDLIARLSTGALAVGSIGLVQASAISRSIATETGQRIDSNQEFVGQGLANIVVGILSGYPGTGSFARSAVNLGAGAQSPIASVFAGIFVLLAMFLLAPLAVYMPTAALAGVLIVIAIGMINRGEIKRLLQGTRSDATIMVVTFLGTIFLPIEFAVLVGILLSFALYIRKTSTPRIAFVVPDKKFKHFQPASHPNQCPQMGILEIHGDLYFGAIHYIEEAVLAHLDSKPDERYLLIRMHTVNQADFSGIHALEHIVSLYRERGGDVFLTRTQENVQEVMHQTDFMTFLGEGHLLEEDSVISYAFHHKLDPAMCIYECPVRVFRECQNLPKFAFVHDVCLTPNDGSTQNVLQLSAQTLHDTLQAQEKMPASDWVVIDVREPREYRRGHIPSAQLQSLGRWMTQEAKMPANKNVVFVCRSGRRSRRVVYFLQEQGYTNLYILQGGLLAWKQAGYLEAIDYWRTDDQDIVKIR